MTAAEERIARAVADTLDGKLLPGLELPEYDDLAALPPTDPRRIAYYRDVDVRLREMGIRSGGGRDADATAFLVAAALSDDPL